MITIPEGFDTDNVRTGHKPMEHEELMPVIRLAIQQELPGIVDAVIKRMEELKKAKEDEFWERLSIEERERMTGA